MENKKDKFEITELFMVKAGKLDWHRRFLGTIKRGVDETGKPMLSGRVQVNDCVIYAQADNEELLGESLDSMVLMILDMNIYNADTITTEIDGVKYFIN